MEVSTNRQMEPARPCFRTAIEPTPHPAHVIMRAAERDTWATPRSFDQVPRGFIFVMNVMHASIDQDMAPVIRVGNFPFVRFYHATSARAGI